MKEILELLKHADGETESIRIAQGKNEIPKGWSATIKSIKKRLRWRLIKQ